MSVRDCDNTKDIKKDINFPYQGTLLWKICIVKTAFFYKFCGFILLP